MNVKILTLVIVLLVSLLCSASAAPRMVAAMETWSESQQSIRYQILPRPRADATSHQPDSPMASTEHGRELEEAAPVRKMVQQNPLRGGQTHRPAGWKSRRPRPRPRLSHKGPMSF